MKRTTLTLGIILTLLQISCTEDNVEPHSNKVNFVNGLLEYNSSLVISEINKITVDLEPKSDVHKSNLNTLIKRIGAQNINLSVTNSCYACIYTLPPQSEIILEVDSLGTLVSRTIDILTPEEDILSCKGIHN